jgi:NAD(P)-dependent dehydrogenase (short-subunit alcohol dehydrogenase family)
MSKLENKIWLSTGGSRGLGRSIALTFADAGASAAVASRTRETCDEVVDIIPGKGQRAFAVEVDVSESDSVAKMVETSESVSMDHAPSDRIV